MLLILSWGISLAILGWVLSHVNGDVLWTALKTYSLSGCAMAILPVCADYTCMGLRLRILLNRGTFPLGVQAELLCVGYNNILPFKAGDALKVVWLTQKLNMSVVEIGPIILWERLLDVAGLTCVALLAYVFTEKTVHNMSILFVLFSVVLIFFVSRRYAAFFHVFYRHFPRKGAEILEKLHENIFEKVAYSWILRGFLLTIVIWTLYFSSFYVVLVYVAHLPLSGEHVLITFAVTCLGMAIPSSPGGLGVFEGGIVLSLSWFGIDASHALPAALFLHSLHFLPTTLTAVWISGRWGGANFRTDS